MAAKNSFCLENRRILVTGPTGHLGLAIVKALTKAKAEVLLAGRSASKLKTLADRIGLNDESSNVRVFEVELTSEQSRRSLAATLNDERMPIHGVVNNAYSGRGGGINYIKPKDFLNACNLNLLAPFDLINLLIDRLADAAEETAGGSSIVNVASMYGHVSPDPRVYPTEEASNPIYYGATKSGLIQMTRYLACHLAPFGIRVNSISPGAFPNPAVQSSSPEFITRLIERVPLRRIGLPDEIALPVQFLLSSASSYVTGADLRVDGGWTAW